MLELKSINQKDNDLDKIRNLYQASFPSAQRIEFEYLMISDGHREILGIYLDDRLVGFMSVLTFGDLSYIAYFAIESGLRGQGLGTRAIGLIGNRKPANRLILDIEATDEMAPDNQLRQRRKQFYLDNGFKEAGISYTWNNVAYETLVKNGDITENEFDEFWQNITSVATKSQK